MSDQFRHLKPGDKLPGLPTKPWNKFLDALHPQAGAPSAIGGKPTTPVEVLVHNATANGLSIYSILGLADSVNPYAADPSRYLAGDIFKGTAPTATSVIAIMQDGVAAGEIGVGRVLGRAACRVDLTNIAHRYASPTTSTGQLTSGATGPVRLIATDTNFATTGPQWAIVLLLGQGQAAAAGGRAVRFALNVALANSTASVLAAVNDFWGGADPGATITVWNLPASTNYIFAGAVGAKGFATFDDIDSKWWIVQMECGAAAAGGGTGLTGTIGD